MRLTATLLVAYAVANAASAQSLLSSAQVTSGGAGGTTTKTDNTEAFRAGSFGGASGTARGQSDFGLLKAYAAVGGIEGPAADDVFAQGLASFSDTLTITGGTGTGTYLIDWTVDGSFSGSSEVIMNANILWDNLPNGVNGGLSGGTQVINGEFPITFTYDVPFSISAQLFVNATLPAGSRASGIVNYFDTASISAIHILTNFSPGASVSSSSGTSYPTPTAVPEPASLVALSTGVLALSKRRRNVP